MSSDRMVNRSSPSKFSGARSAHMTTGSAWSRERRRAHALAAQAAAAAELAALEADEAVVESGGAGDEAAQAEAVDSAGPVDVLEISSDDDPIGSGPPWDIRPDDSLYRGRSIRSVVGSVQTGRDASPVHTRSRFKKGAVDGVVDTPVAQGESAVVVNSESTRPKPRPRPKHKPKSAPVVLSSDDESGPPISSPAKRSQRSCSPNQDPMQVKMPHKKVRREPPGLKYESDSDDGLPPLLEVLRGRPPVTPTTQSRDIDDGAVSASEAYISQLKKHRTSPVRYIDDEAMEEDADGVSVHSEMDDVVSGDEYDLNDPFIDDTALPRNPKRTSEKNVLRSPYKDQGRNLSGSHQSKTHQPSSSPAPLPPASSSIASTTDKRPERGSVPSRKQNKGKGKAPLPSRSPSPEDQKRDAVPSDEEGLSAHELAEIREAARLSLLPSTNRVGESSSGGSSTSPSKVSQASLSNPQSSTKRPVPSATNPRGTKAHSAASRKRINIADLVHRHASAARRSSKSPAPANPVEVTLEELRLDRRCTQLTDRDEVLDRALMDVVLEDTYGDNPPLRRGRFIPWTTTAGVGRVRFSAWADQCPDMDGEIALNAVVFRRSRNIINPSRASPLDVALYPTGMSTTRYNVYMYDAPLTPCVAFSTGLVEHSQLTAPSDTGLRQRSIRMVFHTQEHESFEGFVREITGFTEIHAQFARDAMQFSTRAQAGGPSSDGGSNQGSSPKNRKLRTSPQKMFQARPSASSSNRVLADNFSLPNDVVVPVYDARRVDSFDFDTDLHRLAERLPLYTGGEIPYGSFAGVGYTMTVYQSSAGNWTLGCNIQWVVLFGTPTDD